MLDRLAIILNTCKLCLLVLRLFQVSKAVYVSIVNRFWFMYIYKCCESSGFGTVALATSRMFFFVSAKRVLTNMQIRGSLMW